MDYKAEETMFELANPWVLLLIPLPILIRLVLPTINAPLSAALKVPFFKDMLTITDSKKHYFTAKNHLVPLLLIWVLILLALANPRWIGEPQTLTRDGHNIMLVLDLSPSMAMNDMTWQNKHATRLALVKHAANQFVENRPNDNIGLIVFGERAYLQTPLTYDHHNVLQRLEESTAGLAGKSTSIGDALGLAVKHLENVTNKGRTIILLTDGANNSGVLAPLKAAELARSDNIKIYTIGLGAETDTSSFNGLFLSMNGSAELDEATLTEIAKLTGARYFRATDMKSLQAIYQAINQMETISQDQATVRPQVDYYRWPLGLSWLLLVYLLSEPQRWLTRFKRSSSKEIVE